MRKKIKILIISFLFLWMIITSTMSFAYFKITIPGMASAKMKKPILKIETSVITEKTMSSNIQNNSAEYIFNFLNYIDNEMQETEINEIEFEYTIQIIPSTVNFPVQFRLFDITENREIMLDSNLKSESLNLGLEKVNHHYKVTAQWDMENVNQNLEENLNVEIEIKGVQKR